MTTEIRLWKVQNDNQLKILTSSKFDIEKKLENWIENDISMLSNDLLVIGRQISTDYGGIIDLLCINSSGDLTIVELKREKTPRDITAQILDYASWIKNLTSERVTYIADKYFNECGGESLENAFRKRFNSDLPEVLNGSHSMLIAATQIDPASERIINYLSSSPYEMDINAVTFQCFKYNGNEEFIAKTFLIEPDLIDNSRRSRTFEQLQEIAEYNGVGELYKNLASSLEKHNFKPKKWKYLLSFTGKLGESTNAIFHLIPTMSSCEDGLKFRIYIDRFVKYFRTDEETASSILPPNSKGNWGYEKNYEGYFRTMDDVDHFTAGLDKLESALPSQI